MQAGGQGQVSMLIQGSLEEFLLISSPCGLHYGVLAPTASHSQPSPSQGTLQESLVGQVQVPEEAMLCAGFQCIRYLGCFLRE